MTTEPTAEERNIRFCKLLVSIGLNVHERNMLIEAFVENGSLCRKEERDDIFDDYQHNYKRFLEELSEVKKENE